MKKITINPDNTISQAMRILGKTGGKCLIVMNRNKKLLGTLTDGDLRRSILSGNNLNSTIENSYNRKPTSLTKGKYTKEIALRIMQRQKIELLPILDQNQKVVSYITAGDANIHKEKTAGRKIDTPVVIMAGGKGTRLEPFTKILPKPLIPIREKPVILHIIEKFTNFGIKDFYLTMHYKTRILKAYFEELETDYEVDFVDEKKPLGTASSLQFLKRKIYKPFIVTNCDIIIDIDYKDLYDFHNKNKYDITLVASTKQYEIPYGTCELDDNGLLHRILEKPKYDFLINTGLYIINPSVLKTIPKNKVYHMTNLIKDIKKQQKKIGVYPIDDNSWVDVGQWNEYQKTIKKL